MRFAVHRGVSRPAGCVAFMRYGRITAAMSGGSSGWSVMLACGTYSRTVAPSVGADGEVAVRSEVQRFVFLGRLPTETADEGRVRQHADALAVIESPATAAEAQALLHCFGTG